MASLNNDVIHINLLMWTYLNTTSYNTLEFDSSMNGFIKCQYL